MQGKRMDNSPWGVKASSFSDQIRQGHGTHDVFDAVLFLFRFVDYRLDAVSIIHGEYASECISTEVFDEGPRDLVSVLEQKLFESGRISEGPTVR